MQTNTIDLQVKVGDHVVTQYPHEGKTFVEAREGTEYALRVKNPYPFRVKVVLSVDGVNVVSGDPASGTPEETGYILNAYETQTIKGYRLSDTEVAAFRFIKAEGGYAQAEKGLKGTTGVIGCKVWREKPAPEPVVKEIHHHHTQWRDWYWPSQPPVWNAPHWTWFSSNGTATTNLGLNATSTSATFNSAGITLTAGLNASYTTQNASANGGEMRCMAMNACAAPQAEVAQACADINPFDAGSTFGEKVESKVTSVAFVADTCVAETHLYYAFRAGLTALGIDLSKSTKVAFPAAFSGRYAQPPKGWVG